MLFVEHVYQLNDFVRRTITHLDGKIHDRQARVLLWRLCPSVKRLVECNYKPPIADVEHNDVRKWGRCASPDQKIFREIVEPRI